MKMFEITVLSDHQKLEEYAPTKGRNTLKYICVNEDSTKVPEKYNSFWCLNNEKSWVIYTYKIEIKGSLLYVHCQTKTIELEINPKDFAVRIRLPIETRLMSFEVVSVQYLKDDVVLEPQEPFEQVLEDEECYDELKDLEPVLDTISDSTDTTLGSNKKEEVIVEDLSLTSLLENKDESIFKPLSDKE